MKSLNDKDVSNDWNDKVSLNLKMGYDEKYQLEKGEKVLQYSPEYISLITIDVKYEIIDDVDCNNYMIHDFDYLPVKFCNDKNLDCKIQNDWKNKIVRYQFSFDGSDDSYNRIYSFIGGNHHYNIKDILLVGIDTNIRNIFNQQDKSDFNE